MTLNTLKTLTIYAFVCLLWSKNTYASPFLKIESGTCQPSKTITLGGSGTIVKPCGNLDACIVTAAHVIYHAQNGSTFCHKASTEDGDEFSVELIAVDTLADLAILKLPADAPNLTEAIAIRNVGPLAADELVTMIGFPRSADYMMRYPAKILMPDSPRSFSYGVKVSELLGLTEYGMSGGAVLDKEGRWAGMLSHHALYIGKGGEAVGVLRESLSLQGQLIAIMVLGSYVSEWIDGVFKNSSQLIRSNTNAQALSRGSALLPGVELQETADCSSNRLSAIGGDLTGIGGGDLTGIGGGDLTGIGGGDLTGIGGGDLTGIGGANRSRPCAIFVIPNTTKSSATNLQDPYSLVADSLLKTSANMQQPVIFALKKGKRRIAPVSVIETMKKLQQGYDAEVVPQALLTLARTGNIPANLNEILAARGRTTNLDYSIVWCKSYKSLSECRDQIQDYLRAEIESTSFPRLEEQKSHHQMKLTYPVEASEWFEKRILQAFAQYHDPFEGTFMSSVYEEKRLHEMIPYSLIGSVLHCSSDYYEQYVNPRIKELFGQDLAYIDAFGFGVRARWDVVEKILLRFRSCYEYATTVSIEGALIARATERDYKVGADTYDPNSPVKVKCNSWDPIPVHLQDKVRIHLESLGVREARFEGNTTYGVTDRKIPGGIYSSSRIETVQIKISEKYFYECTADLSPWQEFQHSFQLNNYKDRSIPIFPGGI